MAITTDTTAAEGIAAAPSLHDPRTYDGGVPYEYYRWLRDHDPVAHFDHPTYPGGYWAVTRHADVQRVSRESTTFHNAPDPFLDDGRMAANEGGGSSELLISKDAPEHLKLRKLVNKGFTPRRVADLSDRLRARTDAIIDGLVGRDGCDLVHDLALWLPLHVIADMVGVPEQDRQMVFDWTELTFGFDPAVTAEQRAQAMTEMFMYADGLASQREQEPKDDLMSVLLAAEVDGEKLTKFQIEVFFMLLQNAGSETTRNLITTGTLALLQHPEQLEWLRQHLDQLPTAIEELLRFVTPVIHFTRTPVEDVEIGGQRISAGERLLMVYASANRDERAFEAPDELDLTRTPNDHVAFGAGGPHFCLGASLARLEAKIMFEAILTRFEGLRVDGDPATFPRVSSNLIDGFAELPITWSAIRPTR
jgi:cholest-4-en-3-one 26-monooxygenase